MQNKPLIVGTGKLRVKHHMEKWGGLGGKSLTIFVVVVVVFFYVSFFDSYFVERLAAFNWREVFWEKGVLNIFKINSKQIGVQTKYFEKYLWGIHFW